MPESTSRVTETAAASDIIMPPATACQTCGGMICHFRLGQHARLMRGTSDIAFAINARAHVRRTVCMYAVPYSTCCCCRTCHVMYACTRLLICLTAVNMTCMAAESLRGHSGSQPNHKQSPAVLGGSHCPPCLSNGQSSRTNAYLERGPCARASTGRVWPSRASQAPGHRPEAGP